MEGGWGFNAFEFDDFEPNIDDSEDFNLGSTENRKQFGPPLSEKVLDQAVSDRIPEKTRKTTQWAVSVFRAWCDARGVNGCHRKYGNCSAGGSAAQVRNGSPSLG